MKLFSLLSAAAVVALNANAFSEPKAYNFGQAASDFEKNETSSILSYTNEDPSSQPKTNSLQRSSQGLDYQNSPSNSGQQQKVVLTSARGCFGENGPYFDIEFLWLRATEDSLIYAWKGSQTSFNNVNATVNAKELDQDWEFDPGFRVGLGYNFGYDDWDLHAHYTWLYSYPKTSASVSVDSFGNENADFIVGLFASNPFTNAGATTFQLFQKASSKWQLQFNAWDLDLGRNYYVSKMLALHPIAGLKIALIRQHLTTHYDRPVDQAQPDEFQSMSVREKSRFWAVGPKIGVFGSWQLGYGFNINADIHGALVYGENSGRLHKKGIRNNENTVSLRLTDETYRLRPMAYLNLGLEWERCFWDWMYFSLHLGWETQYWWNQMNFTSFHDTTPEGDLSLTGLNTGIRFDF
ncbi:Lpg1974 family pore-forming outer membrane protein [Simkania sp.]|uniref:Lpg1974 family pore-forming outer membrane protein n=1 Tax=Simkania sp. TaxID=34094 RepID=UPI003B51AF3A